MTTENKLITWVIKSKQLNAGTLQINPVTSKKATGTPIFILSSGEIVETGRYPRPEEKLMPIILRGSEKVGQPQPGIRQDERSIQRFQYYENEKGMTPTEAQKNKMDKQIVAYLQKQHQTAYTNERGEQANPNLSTLLYELISETGEQEKAMKHTSDAIRATEIIKEVFESGIEPFIDMCFGYGYFATGIDKVREFNEFCQWVNNIKVHPRGAEQFIQWYEGEGRDMDILINQACKWMIDGAYTITEKDNVFMLMGQPIGSTKEEVKLHLLNNPKALEYVRSQIKKKKEEAKRPVQQKLEIPGAEAKKLNGGQHNSIKSRLNKAAEINAEAVMLEKTTIIKEHEGAPTEKDCIKVVSEYVEKINSSVGSQA